MLVRPHGLGQNSCLLGAGETMKSTLLSIVLGFAVLLLTGCATAPSTPDTAQEQQPQAASTEPVPTVTEPAVAEPEPAVDGETPEDRVARRGRERWDYIAAGEYDLAYQYLSPGYQVKITRNEYILRLAGQRVRWDDADFKEVECEPEMCGATWVIHWSYNIPVRGAGVYNGDKTTLERWILADGEWYFVPSL